LRHSTPDKASGVLTRDIKVSMGLLEAMVCLNQDLARDIEGWARDFLKGQIREIQGPMRPIQALANVKQGVQTFNRVQQQRSMDQ
jgi:hypothetical protein